MNLILWIIDAIVGFVRRNPIFCLVVLILALGAPSLLAGIASLILYIILGIVVAMVVVSLVLRWRIGKLTDDFRQQQQQQQYRNSQQYGRRREGDVSIRIDPEQTEKRISDDVGDYVDFVEEKEEKN